jgi:hypothetical protein
MDFGGGFGIYTYMPQYFFFFLLFLSKKMEKGLEAKTKVRGKTHIVASIYLFLSFNFFKLRFN